MKQEKGYTEMKDSGILGCGSIPSHWKTIPIKYVALLDGQTNTSHIKPEDIVSFAPMECIRNDKRIPRVAPKSKDNGTYSSFCNGDIAIAKVTPCFENGNICMMDSLVNGYAFGSSELFSIRPTNIVSRYLFYCMQTPYFINGGIATMTGVGGLKRVSSYYMKNAKITLPSWEEQTTIATYLDTQCAKIDEIIAQAKASIEDYKQWKASIIYEAVTKGLDPNVEMKESGVPWIGKMPVNWTISALKNLCTMQAGKNLTSEQISTSGQYPVYGGNGQRGYYSAYNADGHFLLIGRQGALCGNVHDVSGKFWATEHAVVTSATKVTNVCYLYYLLIAMNLNQYASNSAAQPGLSVGNILNLKALLPPINEQARISKFLDDFCSKIDVILTEKQSLIGDLESYKKSLIYEVVTGKRRVCK